MSAASETSQTLSDAETGAIHHELTILIEDTDETVVINTAGNPGSSGIQMLNVGAVPQTINTGGTTTVPRLPAATVAMRPPPGAPAGKAASTS